MIHREAGILGQPENAQSEVRAKRIWIDARIRLRGPGQKLIDVALPLVVNAAPADISDFDCRFARQLALHGNVPVPGRGNLEHRILNSHRKWKLTGHGAGGGIGAAIDDDLLRLKWRIAAERGVAVDRGAV